MEDRIMEKQITEKAIRLILESGYIVPGMSKRLIERRIWTLMAQPNIRKIIELPCRGYGSLIQSTLNVNPTENELNESSLIVCTAIGLAGWAAWTAADRIRDGENTIGGNKSDGDDLYIFATLRPIIDELVHKLSLSDEHRNHITHIIGMMEYANARHFSLGIRMKSSWKSMGAAVPLMALMIKAGSPDKNIALCEDFFRYFILARQLSDDAIDWKEDVGRVGNTGKLKTDCVNNSTLVIKWLERSFDERVKYEVAAEMRKRSRQAMEKARSISCFADTGFLEELPRYYEEMAEGILRKQRKN